MGSHADAMVEPVLSLFRAEHARLWHRPEVPIGGAVADLVVVADGRLCAVELKSAADSLARLPGQLRGYALVADRIVVACAPKHVAAVRSIIEATGVVGVGLVIVEGAAATWRERPAQNPAQISHHVAWSLHARELVSALDARGPDCARGVRGKSLSYVVRRCEQLGFTLDEYRAALVRCWPLRDWDRWKREREAVAAAQRARREQEELAAVGEIGAPA